MTKNALLIFIKNPVAGKVKTRLAKTIGDENALEVYNILLEHTFKITLRITCDKIVCYSDKIVQTYHLKKNGYLQYLQKGSDLGKRMKNAFSSVFTQRYEKAVIIGSDCYELTYEIIEQAFDALSTHDVVIGPAQDGGYYLLGMKSLHTKLFENKKWSTDSVTAETINDIQSMKLKYLMLEELNDIDDAGDLQTPPFNKFIPS